MPSIHTVRKQGKIHGYRVYWREDGQQRTKQFPRKRDADAWYSDLVKNGGRAPASTRETVTDFANRWLDWAETQRAKATVQRDYMPHLNQRIIPLLGRKRLTALSPRVRDEFVAAMLRDGASANTVNATMKVASAMLNRAVKWHALPTNPFAGWERLAVDDDEIVVPTLEQVDALLGVMPTPRDRAIVAVAAFCGTRIGETLALQWGDVRPPVLRVWRALGGADITKLPKNGSRRETCLLPFVAACLADIAPVADPPARGWVFTGHRSGEWMTPDNWSRDVWRPARELLADRCEAWMLAAGERPKRARAVAAGYRSLRVHDLRHFFVSLCASRNVPEGMARDWSGHKDDRSWHRYRHLFVEDVAAAVAELERGIDAWRAPRLPASSG